MTTLMDSVRESISRYREATTEEWTFTEDASGGLHFVDDKKVNFLTCAAAGKILLSIAKYAALGALLAVGGFEISAELGAQIPHAFSLDLGSLGAFKCPLNLYTLASGGTGLGALLGLGIGIRNRSKERHLEQQRSLESQLEQRALNYQGTQDTIMHHTIMHPAESVQNYKPDPSAPRTEVQATPQNETAEQRRARLMAVTFSDPNLASFRGLVSSSAS